MAPKRSELMSEKTIFYSWQSDKPNSTNHGFINECLKKAIKKAGAAETIDESPRIEDANSGTRGAHDIAATIFDKIAKAHIFLADVTLIDDPPIDPEARRFPNPNVLIELGFAAASLSWHNLIFVCNTHFGPIEKLPFDIRTRSIVRYTLAPDDDKASAKVELTARLAKKITAILTAPDESKERQKRRFTEFISEIAPFVARVIIWGNECADRRAKSLDFMQYAYFRFASEFREFANGDVAHEMLVAADLDSLANLLEEIGNFEHASGTKQIFRDLVTQAVAKADELKNEYVGSITFSAQYVRSVLVASSRKLNQIVPRVDSMVLKGQSDDVTSLASDVGEKLLILTYYSIDSGLKLRLEEIGRALHLLDNIDTAIIDGGIRVKQIATQLKASAVQLDELLRTLPDVAD